MRDVAIVAAGMTPFGEIWAKSLRQLFADAALEAMKNGGVDHLDGIYVGNMSAGGFVGQEHIAPMMADEIGLAGVPATRVESACASGAAALRCAWFEVASGASDLVMAAGVEKMNDGADATNVLATAADQENEVYHGVTFPGLYAMIARAHMARHGTTEEDLSWVSVKNHRHGSLNPKAQFPREFTLEQVMNSTPVAEPLRLLHCSPVSDGAAAVLLCPVEAASRYTDSPVIIRASGHATSSMNLADRKNMTELDAVRLAGERAYRAAGVKPSDIDVAEVHDCFAIAEICCIDALGLVPTSEAAGAARSGVTALGGAIPVNTSGGLKAKGHPVGATGIAQVIEIFEQLRGEAGARQVKGARLGLAQNMGGSGASAIVHILERT